MRKVPLGIQSISRSGAGPGGIAGVCLRRAELIDLSPLYQDHPQRRLTAGVTSGMSSSNASAAVRYRGGRQGAWCPADSRDRHTRDGEGQLRLPLHLAELGIDHQQTTVEAGESGRIGETGIAEARPDGAAGIVGAEG